MSERLKKIILAAIFLAGAVVSFMTVQSYVAYVLGMAAGGICDISAEINCTKASQSAYSAFMGVPLGSYGVAFYLSALALLLVSCIFSRFSFGGYLAGLLPFSIFSVLGSIFLLLVSIFELQSLCPLCGILYLISFLQLYLNWKFLRPSGLSNMLKAASKAYQGFISGFFSDLRRFEVKLLVEYLVIVLLIAQIVFLGFISPKLAASRMLSRVDDWPKNQKMTEGLNFKGDVFSDYYSGDLNAPIQIVEFFDYECPFCLKFNQDLKALLTKYQGKYSVIYKNYPLDIACNKYMPQPMHIKACELAEVVRCAGEQGQFHPINNQFLEVNYLEGVNITKSKSAMTEILEMSQLDFTALDDCLKSDRQLEVVRQDVELGQKMGVKGTPAVWINGQQVRPLNISRIENIIKIVLAE